MKAGKLRMDDQRAGKREVECDRGRGVSCRFGQCAVAFAGCAEVYIWVERLLCHHEYPVQGRRSKGLLRAYVEHMTGLSRAQTTRLIGGYRKAGRVALQSTGRPRFTRRYRLLPLKN